MQSLLLTLKVQSASNIGEIYIDLLGVLLWSVTVAGIDIASHCVPVLFKDHNVVAL